MINKIIGILLICAGILILCTINVKFYGITDYGSCYSGGMSITGMPNDYVHETITMSELFKIEK